MSITITDAIGQNTRPAKPSILLAGIQSPMPSPSVVGLNCALGSGCHATLPASVVQKRRLFRSIVTFRMPAFPNPLASDSGHGFV